MGSKKSKEFRKRIAVKEKNKNNWKNKVNPSNVDFSKKEKPKRVREITTAYEKMFLRKEAQLADEKRRETYQPLVYEKIRQMEEEKSQKHEDLSR